jgi:hypothetical protein
MLQHEIAARLSNFIGKISNAIVGIGTEQAMVNITLLHNKIHLGTMLFTSKTFLSVADGATVYVRHVSGSTKYLHSEVAIETVGQWEFTSYVGTTYTLDGTGLELFNRRSDSTYTPEVVFYHTPTIDVLGTPRLNFTFGGGTNPAKAISGEFSERLESVFAPNADILVGLKNQSGSAQFVSFVYNFYEA